MTPAPRLAQHYLFVHINIEELQMTYHRKCAVEIILCLAFKKKKNLLYFLICYIQKESSMSQQNFKVKLGLQPSSPAFRSP